MVNDHAKLKGTIPLDRFSRLVQSLKSNEGNVQVTLGFRKRGKHRTGVVGKAAVSVSLECQACLESLDYPLDIEVRLTLVNSELVLQELSQEEDGLVIEGKRVQLVELIEDGLILGLPMVARHANGECGERYQEVVNLLPQPDADEGARKPFAGLLSSEKKQKIKI